MPIPLTNATLVDALVLVLIGLYILEDIRNGILYGLVQLAGLLLALLAALLFYSAVATQLVNQVGLGYGLAKPLAFGGVWLISDMLYSLTVRRMTALASRDVARSTIGRLLGVVTGLARGVVVATLLLAIVAALPLPEPITNAVADSRIGSRLAERGENVQRALGGVLGDAVQESISMLTVRPESTERVTLSFRVASPRIDADAESQMLALVNRARAENGLEPVTVDPTIRDVARAYSTTMFQQGFFAHVDQQGRHPVRPDAGRRRAPSGGRREPGPRPTVQIAHDGLMNSPGHRANILNAALPPDRHRRRRRRHARQDVHPELRRLIRQRGPRAGTLLDMTTVTTRRPLRPLPVLRLDLQLLRLRSAGDRLRLDPALRRVGRRRDRDAAAAADPQHLLRRRHPQPDDRRAGPRDPVGGLRAARCPARRRDHPRGEPRRVHRRTSERRSARPASIGSASGSRASTTRP